MKDARGDCVLLTDVTAVVERLSLSLPGSKYAKCDFFDSGLGPCAKALAHSLMHTTEAPCKTHVLDSSPLYDMPTVMIGENFPT